MGHMKLAEEGRDMLPENAEERRQGPCAKTSTYPCDVLNFKGK
jgi:hypothetical protein